MTPAAGSLQVTFTPASNGGAAITGYEYQLNSGTWTDTGTLGNSFVDHRPDQRNALRRKRSRGQRPGQRRRRRRPSPATPATIPGQPTITDVTRADQTLIAPRHRRDRRRRADHRLAVQHRRRHHVGDREPHGQHRSPSRRCRATRRTRIANGTSYPITVRAVNSAGASVPSPVTTVGPSATPSAPVVTLTSGDKTIRVAYTDCQQWWFADHRRRVPPQRRHLVRRRHARRARSRSAAWSTACTTTSRFAPTTPSAPARRRSRRRATPAGLPGAPTGVAAVSNTALGRRQLDGSERQRRCRRSPATPRRAYSSRVVDDARSARAPRRPRSTAARSPGSPTTRRTSSPSWRRNSTGSEPGVEPAGPGDSRWPGRRRRP